MFRRFYIPYIAFFVCIALTIFGWNSIRNNVKDDEMRLFQDQSNEVVDLLRQRLIIYQNSLYGIQGLFAASTDVRRNEYQTYLTTIDLQNKYPGISGISFTKRVLNQNKQSFITSVQKDTSLSPIGYPNFSIKPPGDRPEYYVLVYNQSGSGIATSSTFGLDLGTDQNRAPVIYKAVETGQPQATAPIDLFNSTTTQGKGFIIFTPLYTTNVSSFTPEQRRAAAFGVLNSVFRPTDLFKNILQNSNLRSDVDFKVFDGESLNSNTLLYDADKTQYTASYHPKYSQTKKFPVAGRNWTLYFSTSPQFSLNGLQTILPWLVLAGGSLISLLIFFTLYSFARSRQRAEILAEQMTAAFRDSQQRFRLSIENAGDMFFIIDNEGRILEANKRLAENTGYTREQLLALSLKDIDTAWTEERMKADIPKLPLGTSVIREGKQKRKDGTIFPTEASVTLFESSGKRFIMIVARDITERKEADIKLRERTEELQRLNQTMIGREMKMIELKGKLKKALGEQLEQ